MNQEEYSLAASKQKLGTLIPVLKDAKGQVIDGMHRLEVDPKWPSISLAQGYDETQLAIARLVVNVCRRTVPAHEKTLQLKKIAETTGWNAKQIADAIGMSENWVYKYLPDEFKKAEPQQLADSTRRVLNRESQDITPETEADLVKPEAPSTHLIANQTSRPCDISDLFSCDNCKMAVHISRAKNLNGKDLCPLCFDRLKNSVSNTTSKPEASNKPAFKETWEHRKAQMSPQHSIMEQALAVKLSEKGFQFEMDRTFCLRSTTPDFYFPKQNLAVYVDGKPHQGKEDNDQELRDELEKRLHLRILTLPYSQTSKEETQRLFDEIAKEASA